MRKANEEKIKITNFEVEAQEVEVKARRFFGLIRLGKVFVTSEVVCRQ